MQIFDYEIQHNVVKGVENPLPKGLLFIGDPQISTLRPKNRRDENFFETSILKLRSAFNVANSKELIPIILGDLTEYPAEPSKRKNNLIIANILQEFHTLKYLPICLVGNHDLYETKLTKDTILGVLASSLSVLVIKENSQIKLKLANGENIFLGGTPYGVEIPKTVDWMLEGQPDYKIWLTHHDIAYPDFGNFPGSIKPFEIENVDMVINGHLHVFSHPVQIGNTKWFNPGNILRLSKDVAHMKPSVWMWTPEMGIAMEQFVIPHSAPEEAFIQDDEIINEADNYYSRILGEQDFQFTQLLKEDANGLKDNSNQSLDVSQSEKGEILWNILEETCNELNVSSDVKEAIKYNYKTVMELE